MSDGITLLQAQQVLDALVQAQIDDPIGALGSVSVAGRTVSYKNAGDLIELINYWSSIIARKKGAAAGAPKHGRSVANFRGIQ